MRLLLIIIAALSISQYASGQESRNARTDLRKGNKLYQEKKYKEASEQYQKALQKDPGSFTGIFNMGDALYQHKQYEGARQAMQSGLKVTQDKQEQARAYHNMGNTYLAEQKWKEAAQSFKQSLKLHPSDPETKYNLAYANAMMKQQDGGGGNNKKEQQKDKDQQKNDKDQQQQPGDGDQDKNKPEQDKNENKEQQQPDKDPGEEQEGQKDQEEKKDPQHPEVQPSKLSQEQAENLLNALRQEEKKLQDKKEKAKGTPAKLGKDW